MATVVTKGYTDTPISGVSSLTFPRAILNFEKDFRVKSNTAGKEVVVTNLTCPPDIPEKIRFQYTELNNIYAGTGIEPSVSSPTKKGASVLVQLTDIKSVTDSADPDYRIDLPMSYQLVVKVPISGQITAADIREGLGRLLSALYDSGVTDDARLNALLRGSLVPSGL